MKWFYNLKRNEQKCITFFSWAITCMLLFFIDYEINILVCVLIIFMIITGIITLLYYKATKNILYKDYDQLKNSQTSSKKEKSIEVDLPIDTKLINTTYEYRQNHLKNCYDDDYVIIEHKPSYNDSYKMYVKNDRTGKEIGEIRPSDAIKLINLYGDNCVFGGNIIDISMDDNSQYQCTISIWEFIKSKEGE